MQRLGVILLTDTLAGEGGVTPPLAYGIWHRYFYEQGGKSLNRFGPRLFQRQMKIDDARSRNI